MTMQFSPLQGFRYPDTNEYLKDVPTFLQNLSLDVEKRVVQVYTDASARSSKLTNPINGSTSWLQDQKALDVFDGVTWQRVYPYSPKITSGTAAPTGTSGAIGDIYIQF